MAIEVFTVFAVHDRELVEDGTLPDRAVFKTGEVINVLLSLGFREDATGPEWELRLVIGQGAAARVVRARLEVFLTADEYRESAATPFSFVRCAALIRSSESDKFSKGWSNAWASKDPNLNWLWLYRDTFYVTEREPRPSEVDEVMLRIKALHYQRDEKLKRLREQVANFEAIEGQQQRASGSPTRKTIPDDVKLLVWSRDKGACAKCGFVNELHFDHVIPLARGGSDEAVNIQLLCRTCNLAKGDRLV